MKHSFLKFILAIVILVAVGLGIFFVLEPKEKNTIQKETGNEELSQNALVQIITPQPNTIIESPLLIEGQARGNWYFEASFPIRLIDANGMELGVAVAQAQTDWMTENFVPFSATLSFSFPQTETGTLVLQKDNPSGLPQYDKELRIPVLFSSSEKRSIQLTYYDPEKDKDNNGNLLCSSQGLVSVSRTIPVSQTPIQDTIRLLLQGNLTEQEKKQGISTEFPLDGFELTGANVKNGHLTLSFSDPFNQTSGGSCRVGLLWLQIEATAKQFPEVLSVSFLPEELFQP